MQQKAIQDGALDQEMNVIKPMSIKENYMLKPPVIPAKVNEVVRKTTLAGTYERVVQKGCQQGNFMSNHPGHDTLTSQILFIFSLFVDDVEMINP